MKKNSEATRCAWTGNDAQMIEYHDHEWGVPVHDDTKLFEYIVLDAFQAGLNWKTILHKRENFRKAFDDFDVEKIAHYGEKKFEALMRDASIVRNKQKITATILNAKAFIEIQKEFGTFDKYIWSFTKRKTICNSWQTIAEVPAKTAESDAMSRDLIHRGFKFVGSTICYAFMQAAGMVNDHLIDCPQYDTLSKAAQ